MAKTFDSKCLELARYFLKDVPDDKRAALDEEELAREIQSTIENYLEFIE